MKKLILVIVLLGAAMALAGCAASSGGASEVSDIGGTVSMTKEESAVISTTEEQRSIEPLADIINMAALVEENTRSIEMTDEQTEIVTELFGTFAKMNLLFFNSNYECKTALDIFNGTEYECARIFADSRGANPENFSATTAGNLNNDRLIKYTGNAVDTIAEYNALRRRYFTDGFIERFDYTKDVNGIGKLWEENGAVYRTCRDDGVTLTLGEDGAAIPLYVRGCEEDNGVITVRVFKELTEVSGQPDGEMLTFTLAVQPEGGFKVDKITNGSGDETFKFYDKFELMI